MTQLLASNVDLAQKETHKQPLVSPSDAAMQLEVIIKHPASIGWGVWSRSMTLGLGWVFLIARHTDNGEPNLMPAVGPDNYYCGDCSESSNSRKHIMV